MSISGENLDFYSDLEPFDDFADFANFDAYNSIPSDWVVMVGDVASSTKAIANGRYKDVNLIGAAVITSVLNTCGDIQVPFVFGGDGGAVVVPASVATAAVDALIRLQSHSSSNMELTLRAAAVPVSRIRAEGHDLTVRKYRLNDRNHLAMFAGGGISHVDSILKHGTPSDPHVLQSEQPTKPPNLQGLSCRWEPLTAVHGKVISLLVQPSSMSNPGEVLGQVLMQIRSILDDSIQAHAPVRKSNMRFRWPPRGLRPEVRMLAQSLGTIKAWGWALMTSAVQKCCHALKVKVGGYDGVMYLEEIRAQTDFRKFDDCLRTVLDCKPSQVKEIEVYLDTMHMNGQLAYGMHVDQHALMTCLVFSLERSEHIHFIDAAGGGFARAAIDMKAQLASLRHL